jgi:hypothetical protein
MLKECKQALRITTDAYNGELCSLMEAAARDLEIAGVIIPGVVSFHEEEQTEEQNTVTVTVDDSSMDDPLVKRAIFTYVRMHFGSPADFDRLRESYNLQKVQLMHAEGYTDFGGDGE